MFTMQQLGCYNLLYVQDTNVTHNPSGTSKAKEYQKYILFSPASSVHATSGVLSPA